MSEFPRQLSILDLLRHVREQLDRSVAIAKAAESYTNSGDPQQAVSILLGIEQPLYEATTFINAASLINRISSS